MPLIRLTLACAAAALLAACATNGSLPYPYGGAYGTPDAAKRDATQALRGNPQARTIYREGPVTGREGDLSPEESARQEAITYCSSVSLSARMLDVRKERLPSRGGIFGRGAPATDYERVALTFACERGQP
ncbi:hypothetical protein [Ottowia sp.]|uniref:hypothetical protein n=1 Tax=Ottowia sp. TaxID=1898956 RepID=UPI002CC2A157|nr:hypothetical protein [Ottowia sp.]HOB66565.1 hypothetical protein [Ottowia sp.]HPZ58871.1 hypothetical protein [Ottowia sp.]HQD47892.1 hypothetical protein [Ottowia sp.]